MKRHDIRKRKTDLKKNHTRYHSLKALGEAVIRVYTTLIENKTLDKGQFLTRLKKQPKKILLALEKGLEGFIAIAKVQFNKIVKIDHKEGAIQYAFRKLKRYFWQDLQSI